MARVDFAEKETPRHVRQRLANYGGSNQYGRALWRVVLAERRIVIRGGVFHEFEETGSLEQFDFDRDGRITHKPISPRCVTAGIMETPMYGVDGWILERWFPPGIWGDRETWETSLAQDGVTPLMGPYPAEGDYWMLGGPWEKLPALDDLFQAIRVWEHERENRPANFELAMRVHLKNKQDAQEARYHKLVAALEEYRRSEILPVMHSTSLSAQMVRNGLQSRLGQKSHLGA